MNSSVTKDLLMFQSVKGMAAKELQVVQSGKGYSVVEDGVIRHLQERQDKLTRKPREELDSYNREELDMIEDFFMAAKL